ncbi:hypothetical protein [Subsaximicrobium wynnwilliamsii]|nr:hypothetical protein [Subsaximicrobium wynnwilliamsii]
MAKLGFKTTALLESRTKIKSSEFLDTFLLAIIHYQSFGFQNLKP